MNYLNYDGVLAQFLRITGMRAEDFSHISLLENAENYVISHLSVTPETLTEDRLSACEYAAAAVAVYDYAFELCLKERRVMSDTGEVSAERADGSLIDTARAMREDALRQLAALGIAEHGGFAFMGV